jgi:VanZ family protein
MMRRLASWVPPLLWMAIILGFSSGEFSADRTGSFVGPILKWLWPDATAGQLAAVHGLVRKAAHVVEYAVLGGLWFRTLVHTWPRRPGAAAWLAFALAVAWAVVDESHQATLSSRTGSARDVALDAAGAAVAVVAMRLGWGLAADLATTVLLWIAAAGGAAFVGINLVAGVSSGALWVSAPLALALLLVPWWRRRRRRAE